LPLLLSLQLPLGIHAGVAVNNPRLSVSNGVAVRVDALSNSDAGH
jgi:hypothetical protein